MIMRDAQATVCLKEFGARRQGERGEGGKARF